MPMSMVFVASPTGGKLGGKPYIATDKGREQDRTIFRKGSLSNT